MLFRSTEPPNLGPRPQTRKDRNADPRAEDSGRLGDHAEAVPRRPRGFPRSIQVERVRESRGPQAYVNSAVIIEQKEVSLTAFFQILPLLVLNAAPPVKRRAVPSLYCLHRDEWHNFSPKKSLSAERHALFFTPKLSDPSLR